MAHSLLIGWGWISSTSSPWCEIWAWISWAAMDAVFWLVTMVVIPPPMVHRDHWQDVVLMRVSHAWVLLGALAGLAAPHSDADSRDDEHDQQQRYDQVEKVDSASYCLQVSGWTALLHILFPKPSLQPITTDTLLKLLNQFSFKTLHFCELLYKHKREECIASAV